MASLYLVPTPIGNLEDITFRAVRILKEVDVVLAEDTRTSGKLLKHFAVDTPMRSHHQHNEHKVVERLIEEMQSGSQFALISDAGTPAISDPGFLLVRACREAGIKVECLPGATAFVPALAASGIPCDRFVFEGFLPVKKGRQTRIMQIAEESKTTVLYESPHRLLKCLQQLREFCGGDRTAAVFREISKLHEEHVVDSLDALVGHFSDKKIKGEIVVVVAGQPTKKSGKADLS